MTFAQAQGPAVENFFVRQATSIAVAAVTFLMILLAFIFYRMEESGFAARAWVVHSREVIKHAETLLAEMGDAELSHGAYMMTGDDKILARYKELTQSLPDDNASVGEIPSHSIAEELQTLQRLTADNPVQQKNINGAAASLGKLMDYLASTLGETRAGTIKIGAQAIDFEVRESLMRPVHTALDAMIAEENRLLTEREHIEKTGALGNNLLILAGMAVFYIVVVLAMRLCQKAEKHARAQFLREREESEREIRKHIDTLKRSNQELDDFAYIASHDLKEPLRGLTNNANFLREDLAGSATPEISKRLGRMTYLCQRLERLVDDLLYFSRLGRQDLAIQKTDLNDVIKDIGLTMETTLREANAVIVTPRDLPTIVCDLPRVTEVFRNLIVNGVKYNRNDEKRIEIGCVDRAPAGNDNAGRAFYVRDNGIGIPKQFYSDVFRIFKRLNAEDDGIKGTGVGLTFVRKIIERHGGKIWLDSEVGKGTTFYFTLNTTKEAS